MTAAAWAPQIEGELTRRLAFWTRRPARDRPRTVVGIRQRTFGMKAGLGGHSRRPARIARHAGPLRANKGPTLCAARLRPHRHGHEFGLERGQISANAACRGPRLGPGADRRPARTRTPMASTSVVSANVIRDLERRQIDAITAKRRVPEFAPGDTVKVMVKVMEDTERRQRQEEGRRETQGGRQGARLPRCRPTRASYRPLGRRHQRELHGAQDLLRRGRRARVPASTHPTLPEIEVVRRGKVRRAKLYYLRGRRGKSARIFERTERAPSASTPPSRASSGRKAKPRTDKIKGIWAPTSPGT